MANYDAEGQWNAAVAFFEGDQAANLAVLSPRPTVYREGMERLEDQLPLIIVGLNGGQQQRDRASGDNRHQTFGTKLHLIIAAKGKDQPTSNTNCLAIVSAIINDLAGTGAFMGTDRSSLFAAVVDGWDWDQADADDLIAQAFIDITATYYRY